MPYLFFLVIHVLLAEVINSNYKVRTKINTLEFILHSIQTVAYTVVHLNPPYLELFLGKPGNNTPESMR